MMTTMNRTSSSSSSFLIGMTIRNELENIRRAVTCPICLCTLSTSSTSTDGGGGSVTLVGCSHSFCYQCILQQTQHGNKSRSSSNKNMVCPLCQIPFTRRSIQRHPQQEQQQHGNRGGGGGGRTTTTSTTAKDTNDSETHHSTTRRMVQHYKSLTIQFGIAPIQYTPSIATCTQQPPLQSQYSSSSSQYEEDIDTDDIDTDDDAKEEKENDDTDDDDDPIELDDDSDTNVAVAVNTTDTRNPPRTATPQHRTTTTTTRTNPTNHHHHHSSRQQQRQRRNDIQDQYHASQYMYQSLIRLHQQQQQQQQEEHDADKTVRNTTTTTTSSVAAAVAAVVVASQPTTTAPMVPVVSLLLLQEQQQIVQANQRYYHQHQQRNRRRRRPPNQTCRGGTTDTDIVAAQVATAAVRVLVPPPMSSSSLVWTNIVQAAQSQELANRNMEEEDDDDDDNIENDDIENDHGGCTNETTTTNSFVPPKLPPNWNDEAINNNDDEDDDETTECPQFYSAIDQLPPSPKNQQLPTRPPTDPIVPPPQPDNREDDDHNEMVTGDETKKDHHHHGEDDDKDELVVDDETNKDQCHHHFPNGNNTMTATAVTTMKRANHPTTIDVPVSFMYDHPDSDTNEDDDSIPAASHIPPLSIHHQEQKRRVSKIAVLSQPSLSDAISGGKSSCITEVSSLLEDNCGANIGITCKSPLRFARKSSIGSNSNDDTKGFEMTSSNDDDDPQLEDTVATMFQIGDIVQVHPRTGPGMNQLGGIAEITQIHSNRSGDNATTSTASYDVRYVLNRRQREHSVAACYISVAPEYNETRDNNSMRHEDAKTTMTTMTWKEQKRNLSTRRSCPNPVVVLSSPLRAALLADGCDVDGIATRKALARFNRKSFINSEKENYACQHKVTQQGTERSKGFVRPEMKRKALLPQRTSVSKATARGQPTKRHKISQNAATRHVNEMVVDGDAWTNAMKCQMADDMYRSKIQTALQKGIVYISTSLLSTIEQEQLQELCQMVHKNMKVKLKITDTIETKRTTMCILPICVTPQATSTIDECNNVVADRRSMKAMFACLDGVPIVSSSWISHCLQQKAVIVPEPNMFVRTLPTKTMIQNISDYGVASHAARIHHVQQNYSSAPYQPLRQVKLVYMIGFDTQSIDAADFGTLLRRTGVNDVIMNPSIALSSLKEFMRKSIDSATKSGSNEYYVVICNDGAKTVNTKLSISDSFAKTIDRYTSHVSKQKNANRRLMVVNLQWLFDSVTCGTLLPADTTSTNEIEPDEHERTFCYRPIDDTASELWQKTK